MIKDILVNLSLGERGGFAGEYAISIATAFEAHVAGTIRSFHCRAPAISPPT